MIYKMQKGSKFREESFGCILRAPVDVVIKTGQTFYKFGFLELEILKVCDGKNNLDYIVEIITEKYDVKLGEAKRDISAFLKNLAEIGIIKEIRK
ncbi:MAG: PqqD family protein [Promethearchaeota archaeon]